jgi:hypothetical protein
MLGYLLERAAFMYLNVSGCQTIHCVLVHILTAIFLFCFFLFNTYVTID